MSQICLNTDYLEKTILPKLKDCQTKLSHSYNMISNTQIPGDFKNKKDVEYLKSLLIKCEEVINGNYDLLMKNIDWALVTKSMPKTWSSTQVLWLKSKADAHAKSLSITPLEWP